MVTAFILSPLATTFLATTIAARLVSFEPFVRS
jgi:hypothetical protein